MSHEEDNSQGFSLLDPRLPSIPDSEEGTRKIRSNAKSKLQWDFMVAIKIHEHPQDPFGQRSFPVAQAIEFTLGLNPTLRDSDKVRSGVFNYGAGPVLELAYPIRLPVSTRYSLKPAYSTDLTSPFTPFAVLPTTGPDGLARAWLPATAGRGFLRLETVIAP